MIHTCGLGPAFETIDRFGRKKARKIDGTVKKEYFTVNCVSRVINYYFRTESAKDESRNTQQTPKILRFLFGLLADSIVFVNS
jgi:hypothetical protein